MMKLCAALLLTAVVAASAYEKLSLQQVLSWREPNPAPEGIVSATTVTDFIDSRVDNFDPHNSATYRQRYFLNGEFFQPGGPLFIFVGGEWAIQPYRLEYSLMREMAQEENGYMFYLEHRFYGQSFPTANVSDENLRFLTAEQALADLAHFVEYIKRPDVFPGAQDSPVVVVGVHYSGTLAAWFRQQYPHLAIAAWASGAPVLSVENQLEYKEVAGAVYRRAGGNECYDRIDRGFAEMEALVAAGELAELGRIFNLCYPLENEDDISTFFLVISEFYSNLAQFSTYIPIGYVCQLITSDEEATDAEGVAKVLIDLLDDQCLPISFDRFIEAELETELDAPAVQYGIRQITYQSCVQFGWFHTSDGVHQPFGSSFPEEYFDRVCERIFGDLAHRLEENSDHVNLRFGGLNPDVDNVIYSHGMNDPWRTVGIQESFTNRRIAFVTPGASQGADLSPIGPFDSPALYAAKLLIKYTIRSWVTGGPIAIPYPSPPGGSDGPPPPIPNLY